MKFLKKMDPVLFFYVRLSSLWLFSLGAAILFVSWLRTDSLRADWTDPVLISLLYGFTFSTMVSLTFATMMRPFEFVGTLAFAIYHLATSRQLGDTSPATLLVPILGAIMSLMLFQVSKFLLRRHQKQLEKNEGAGYDSETVWEKS